VPTYSLVIPAYNEEGVMLELAAGLTELMDAPDGDAEAILVDGGSRDRCRGPCPQREVDAFLSGGKSVLLVDDHVPVDQLLAPVFRQALEASR
jgi:hypothetical protein